MPFDRSQRVREYLDAYAANDPSVMQLDIADDFEFSAPPDPSLDRAGFFEKCWPDEPWVRSFDIVRLVENGDEVIVTYEANRLDGVRFRNTEVLAFSGEQLVRQEVYFGWELG